MTPAPHLILAACLVLGACEAAPTVEELRTTDAAACSGAGFASGSDAHGLCLLLQETNRRLEAVERRLNFLEVDVRSRNGYGRCLPGPC
ncbi:MAG: hypothetical protein R3D28_25720 [Geminicoccaceae bacterium]